MRKADREAVGRLWSALMASHEAVDDRFAASDDAFERWSNDFAQWLQSESRKMFVAVDGEAVCGFATAERWNTAPIYRERPGVFIPEIFVDPDFRRRGHGRSLVDAVREWADAIDARELRVGVLAGNEAGCAFWEAVGGDVVAKTFSVTLKGAEDDSPATDRRIGFRV